MYTIQTIHNFPFDPFISAIIFIQTFHMKNLVLFFLITVVSLQLQGQKDGFAESNGVKIYYRTFGTGIPMLIINGGPGLNSDGFIDLAKTLSTHNQTIIYDQRGTGRSDDAKNRCLDYYYATNG